MIKGDFLSAAERKELARTVRRPSEGAGVVRRANAILLLDDGWSCVEIGKALYLDDDTVRTWYKHYRLGGFDLLTTFDWKGGTSLLCPKQIEALCVFLEVRLCRSTGEIRAYIRSEFGVIYSHAGCIKLLHRLGFEYKKPKKLPPCPDEAVQQDFIDRYNGLQRNLPADEAIYFADAVHPEYQSRPAFGWMKKGANIAIKTTSGRQRVNIHGAVCLENFDTPFVEVERVNSDSSIALLKKIEAQNPTKRKIHVIWDNAAYHKCQHVRRCCQTN